MNSDECYKPKFYAGKWYVHCTVTGWMGPCFNHLGPAQAMCDRKNTPPKTGPETERSDRMQTYGY